MKCEVLEDPQDFIVCGVNLKSVKIGNSRKSCAQKGVERRKAYGRVPDTIATSQAQTNNSGQ